MTFRSYFKGIVAAFLALAFSAHADDPRVYTTGFSIVIKLSGELYGSLPANYQNQIDAQTVALEPQDLPMITPIATTEDNRVQRQICLSAGFIDLVNHICHAKAIDRIQPGFFDQYVKNLALICSNDVTAQAPNIVEEKFWTDDVMNDQLSYFNQVIGFLTAVNLSHHYLGHYTKYAGKLMGSGETTSPINKYLTTDEWEHSVRAGVVNSLDCALSTDGPRALFDAIDHMPYRPAWASYIVPPEVDIKKLNKKLEGYETEFFRGQLR